MPMSSRGPGRHRPLRRGARPPLAPEYPRGEQPSRPFPAAREGRGPRGRVVVIGGVGGSGEGWAAPGHPPEEGAGAAWPGAPGGGTGAPLGAFLLARRGEPPPPRGCYSHCRFSHIIQDRDRDGGGRAARPSSSSSSSRDGQGRPPASSCSHREGAAQGAATGSAPHRPGAAGGTAGHGRAPPAEPRAPHPAVLGGFLGRGGHGGPPAAAATPAGEELPAKSGRRPRRRRHCPRGSRGAPQGERRWGRGEGGADGAAATATATAAALAFVGVRVGVWAAWRPQVVSWAKAVKGGPAGLGEGGFIGQTKPTPRFEPRRDSRRCHLKTQT